MIRLLSQLITVLLFGMIAFVIYDHYRRPLTTPPLVPPIVLAPLTQQIDHILIEKSARKLTVFHDGKALRTYQIALGFAPAGDKVKQGDGKTPEGIFKINRRNSKSSYHLSLGLDYPLPQDIAAAKAAGVNPGGDIFIHGQPNAMASLATIRSDWTAGCIAISDLEIEELWRVVQTGTTVEIRP